MSPALTRCPALNEFNIAPTSTIDKRSHELDQDQSSTQRSNKRKKDVLSSQRMPPISSADDIPWLFCVLGAGGISYHKLHELSPDAQDKVTASFQSYFSAKNDAQYDATQAIHHNTYSNMVRVSNWPANEKKGCCVQNFVIARGKISSITHQVGECEACGPCQRKGCPCARIIVHHGQWALCWYRQGSGASSGTEWQDAAYWIR